ncbi:MAG: heavy-metal-associated domain-containing protein, partial [Chitinophagaceae bacterium]
MTHTYNIAGMTCNNCVAKAKSELLKVGDITEANVQLNAPQATITMQKHIPTSVLQQAISKSGHYIISDADTEMYHNHMMNGEEVAEKNSYYPIFLIFAYITVITGLIQVVQGQFDWMQWMRHFMAGFFLVFSFFKLMNLKGFAEGYTTYDVIARNFYSWGVIYPFIELGLGIAYLTGFNPVATNAITFFVMGVSTIGVVQSMIAKRTIQCACVGTVFKLPLGKVTLFEDLLMVLM